MCEWFNGALDEPVRCTRIEEEEPGPNTQKEWSSKMDLSCNRLILWDGWNPKDLASKLIAGSLRSRMNRLLEFAKSYVEKADHFDTLSLIFSGSAIATVRSSYFRNPEERRAEWARVRELAQSCPGRSSALFVSLMPIPLTPEVPPIALAITVVGKDNCEHLLKLWPFVEETNGALRFGLQDDFVSLSREPEYVSRYLSWYHGIEFNGHGSGGPV